MKIKRRKNDEKNDFAVEVVEKTRNKLFPNSSEMCILSSKKNLFDQIRASVPAIDGAVDSCVQIAGGFSAKCENKENEKMLDMFLKQVNVGGISRGIDSFVTSLFSSLLTYGTAIGEVVYDDDLKGFSLFNSDLVGISMKRTDGGRHVELCTNENGIDVPITPRDNVFCCVLDPKPGEIVGRSVLESLPFVSSILMQIFESVDTNWRRFGDIRYCVTCKNGTNTHASEKASSIAKKWQEAMSSGEVRDFVAVGDVDVKVIGADSQVLSSEIPVAQLMEQIVAKIGIPPFLLGMKNSTTETMARQQMMFFSCKIDHYRSLVTPILQSICEKYLRLYGIDEEVEIRWNKLSFQ